MTLELLNPEGLPVPESYTQVIAASGSRLVFANVGRALTAVGARPDQVTKLTIYVVQYHSV